MGNRRKYYLDLLKILSIVGMLALHTQRSLKTGICYNSMLYYWGRFCMPVFFMVNGSLILSKQNYDKDYVKRKLLNIFRILLIWALVDVVYYVLSGKISDISLLLKAAAKGLLGYGLVPFWFLFTFSIIYVVLLFSFNFIRKNIRAVILILGLICITIDACSLWNILRGGVFYSKRDIAEI